MKTTAAFFFATLSVLLGACDGSSSRPPASAGAPDAPLHTEVPADSLKRTSGTKQPVPFVSPTKVGRILGDRTPSPPASR
jgi:hypothetical protein